MDHATAYANEWEFMEGVEAASWTPSGSSAVTGVRVVRDEVNRRDMMRVGDLAIEPTLTAFIAWKASAASFDPKPGDRITDASSDVWVIQSAVNQMFKTKWRLVCTKLVS